MYDAANRETEQEDPLNRITTSAYDAAGRQTLRIDPRGFRTTYSYDANDNLTGRAYPDSSRATFVFDSLNQMTTMEDSTGRYTTVYDAISKRVSVTDPASKTITYSYNAEGNRSTMIDPDSGRFTYSYNPDNLLITLVNPQNDRTTYSYDEQNRRVGILRANLTRTSFSYDANSQVVNLVHRKSDNSVIDSFGYTYDAAGNRVSIIEADNSRTTYSYDATNQLTSTHRTGTTSYSATFTYDVSGNRIKNEKDTVLTRFEYDVANQLTVQIDAAGRTTYTFDAAGNQQVVLEPSMNRTTTTWNYENQPTVYEAPTNALVTMTYNPENRRTSKETVSYKNNFIWDVESDNVLLETDDFNVTQVVYTNDPFEFGYLVSQRRSSTTNWYHFDALGSTRDLTNSSETITDSYLYDAWGNQLTTTGTTTNPFRWTGNVGYYYDTELESYYIRARVYEPTIGRWLSTDPLGFVDGFGLYLAYFIPNGVDPSGMVCQCCKWCQTIEGNYDWDPIANPSFGGGGTITHYSVRPKGCGTEEKSVPFSKCGRGVGFYSCCDNPGYANTLSVPLKVWRWNGAAEKEHASASVEMANKIFKKCCIKFDWSGTLTDTKKNAGGYRRDLPI